MQKLNAVERPKTGTSENQHLVLVRNYTACMTQIYRMTLRCKQYCYFFYTKKDTIIHLALDKMTLRYLLNDYFFSACMIQISSYTKALIDTSPEFLVHERGEMTIKVNKR